MAKTNFPIMEYANDPDMRPYLKDLLETKKLGRGKSRFYGVLHQPTRSPVKPWIARVKDPSGVWREKGEVDIYQ